MFVFPVIGGSFGVAGPKFGVNNEKTATSLPRILGKELGVFFIPVLLS